MNTVPPPVNVRIEQLDHAIGLTVARPQISWQLPKGSADQVAYQIVAGRWDSGRVTSDRALLIPYGGSTLHSRERVECRVKVWTEAGQSDWSLPAHFEMGLLAAEDWQASWIAPPEGDVPAPGSRPGWQLRTEFELVAPAERARLYATAHGIYEVFINGERVGDHELTPGFTKYDDILQVQTLDVTDHLHVGKNVIGVILADGWYRGQLSAFRFFNQFGDRLALLAQLVVASEGGETTVIGTGPNWLSATGPIVSADLMQGMVVDHRLGDPGWASPECYSADALGWVNVAAVSHDLSRLQSSPAPPVRRVQELSARAVTRIDENRQVADLGQLINGWVRLKNLGPAGTKLTLTHGQVLDDSGDVNMTHLDVRGVIEELGYAVDLPEGIGPIQVDHVTSAGLPGEVYEARQSTKGFRYVRIEGHPGNVLPDDIVGLSVHTDMPRTGWFECSDDRINKLHEMTVWTFRDNALDIATDCPDIERSGWMSEPGTFGLSATFLFDTAGFFTKMLRDAAADQKDDGTYYNRVPEIDHAGTEEILPAGCAGFGDGAVIVPWRLFSAYGDTRVIEEQWESMAAWVERCARLARSARHPERQKRQPTPAEHEQFILDTGVELAEWGAPCAYDDQRQPVPLHDEWNPSNTRGRNDGVFATAYLALSARLLSKMALVVGRTAEHERYTALADSVTDAWWTEYGSDTGEITPNTQSNHVRALSFELAPQHLRATVAGNLVKLVREAGNHAGTGVFASAYLLQALADEGYSDVAYDLLLQETWPSWLTMLDRGSTTMWEWWDSVDGEGVPKSSMCQFAHGAFTTFLHSHVAGIRQVDGESAYRRFRIAPTPGPGLTWARARLDCPYGKIEVRWESSGGRFTLVATVPPGTSAVVTLPDGSSREAGPGDHEYACDLERSQEQRGGSQAGAV